MQNKIKSQTLIIVLLAVIIGSSCNSTRHLKDGEFLLKENVVKFDDTRYINDKAAMSDNLSSAIVQKPNSSFIIDGFKTKLFLYNLRYDKYEKDSSNYQLKSRSVEPPVIYDSSSIPQSKRYMESYLFQQGYFYAQIKDTTLFNEKKKKATVEYEVNTGYNYIIRRVFFNKIPDTMVKGFVRDAFNGTFLRAGKPYSIDLIDQERTRIVDIMRDYGYYYFAKDNISFVLDTADKEVMKLDENLLKNATDLLSRKEEHRPTLDIYIDIKDNEDSTAFKRFAINKIFVYPDFKDKSDVRDSTMKSVKINKTLFRYHRYYIRPKVIHNHIFISSDKYYAQSDYDKTITELNQLGAFETVRVMYFEDTARALTDGGNWMNCAVLMSPAKKYDFNTSWEASNGTTYTLGTGLTITGRNNNVARGANLLTVVLNGGIESQLDSATGNLFILTKTAGINTSLEFPKFMFPISKERYSIRNTPRTEMALGANLLDRVNYFQLINLTTRFTYKWKETSTKNWEVTPFFVNDISRPRTDSAFKARLDASEYLSNIYRETFIEGENITWTYSTASKAKFYDDYSYVRLGFEEAGGIVNSLNRVQKNLTASYSQYLRLDYDLRHFIVQRHAVTALRLYGGIGIPYGNDKGRTLPYLKQYFVGGPFSMRGFRIRTLGPGSYLADSTRKATEASTKYIDRTGDIKIEMNAEYRFDIFKMFGGLFKFNGAIFGDAGNIWLANPTPEFPNGELNLSRLYTDFAFDSGLGIRLDIAELFVFRVDAAIPLKIPGRYDPNSEDRQGWVIKQIDPLYDQWRKKNLIFNFAIGYPF